VNSGALQLDMKSLKRFSQVIIASISSLVSAPLGFTQIYTSGDWTYTLNASNEATIAAYNGASSSVSIPSNIDGFPVTTLRNSDWVSIFGPANTNIVSVTIPDSVTTIGTFAFYECRGLTSVSIPNSVTNIGEYAFKDCSGLTDIVLPNAITELKWWVLAGCTGLSTLTIPESVTSISSYALAYCTGLTNLILGRNVVSIGYAALEACTGLTTLIIPSSVTSLGAHVFNGCTNLGSIYFLGNAPSADAAVFSWLPVGTAYYASGSAGWSATFEGWPTQAYSLPTSDMDGDGVNYFRETADGTNPSDPTSSNPLSKGLVVYYPFRGNFDDASGNGNNLTNVDSSSVLSAGRFGETSGSLKLGNTIESVQPLGISGNQFFSFSIWVKTAAVDISTINIGFFGMGPSANAGDSVGLGAFPNYSNSLYVYGNNADLFAPTMNNNAFHQWSSVTYVYAGSIPNSKLYLNGVAIDFTNHPRSTDIRNMVSSKIEFGSGGLPFDTFISDFRMYNRALSESEVRQLFYTEAFSDTQKQFVAANPFVAGLYSASEYNANRTNGRIDVLTNPSAFNLFTQSDYESFGALQFSNGVSSVLTNPSFFNLFTQQDFDSNRATGQSDVINNPASYDLYTSESIMDLRMEGLMIPKTGGVASVTFQPQTTTNLATKPFTNNGAPITFDIPMSANHSFMRVEAKPFSTPVPPQP